MAPDGRRTRTLNTLSLHLRPTTPARRLHHQVPLGRFRLKRPSHQHTGSSVAHHHDDADHDHPITWPAPPAPAHQTTGAARWSGAPSSGWGWSVARDSRAQIGRAHERTARRWSPPLTSASAGAPGAARRSPARDCHYSRVAVPSPLGMHERAVSTAAMALLHAGNRGTGLRRMRHTRLEAVLRDAKARTRSRQLRLRDLRHSGTGPLGLGASKSSFFAALTVLGPERVRGEAISGAPPHVGGSSGARGRRLPPDGPVEVRHSLIRALPEAGAARTLNRRARLRRIVAGPGEEQEVVLPHAPGATRRMKRRRFFAIPPCAFLGFLEALSPRSRGDADAPTAARSASISFAFSPWRARPGDGQPYYFRLHEAVR